MSDSHINGPIQPCPWTVLSADASTPVNERRDAAEHRQHILTVARALYAEHGVDTVTMHQIARAAGLGQGTLYRRYANKGLLCTALLDESMQRFQREILSYLERVGDAVPMLEQLNYILLQVMTFNEDNASLLEAITDAACSNRRTQPYGGPFYHWLHQVGLVLLQRAVTRKEISPLDLEYTIDVVLAPLAIDLYLYQRDTLGFTQERIATGLQHFLSHGLGAKATEL